MHTSTTSLNIEKALPSFTTLPHPINHPYSKSINYNIYRLLSNGLTHTTYYNYNPHLKHMISKTPRPNPHLYLPAPKTYLTSIVRVILAMSLIIEGILILILIIFYPINVHTLLHVLALVWKKLPQYTTLKYLHITLAYVTLLYIMTPSARHSNSIISKTSTSILIALSIVSYFVPQSLIPLITPTLLTSPIKLGITALKWSGVTDCPALNPLTPSFLLTISALFVAILILTYIRRPRGSNDPRDPRVY